MKVARDNIPISTSGDFLELAPDAVVVVDGAGRIALVNARTEALFGYPRDELLGEPVEILLPDRFQESHPRHRQAYFDSPRVRPMGAGLELYGRHRDGREIPVEVSLSPAETPDGLVVLGTIRDNSQHKAVERSLTGILEASQNEIYIFDVETLHFIHVTQGARFNLGYSMAELAGMTPLDLEPDFDRATFEELVRPLREGECDKLEFETVHRRKDGSEYFVEVHLQCFEYDGHPVFVAINLDTTKRKDAEAALRESQERLEERVIERTIALQEAKLEAESANLIKSRFLAAASHDLRQPIQAAMLYLSLLDAKLDEPARRELAAPLHESLDTMSDLLDALLDFSRFEAGTVVPEPRDFRLTELVDRIVNNYRPLAAEKGLALSADFDEFSVHSDPKLLERVLGNFVSNAIRYTAQGGISIRCRLEGENVLLSVTDTGVGIARRELDRIFDEYYQIDNPSRDRRKGLGLGLAIARHIAKLLDVDVDVQSEPGRGSTFSLAVPRVADTVVVDPAEEAPRPAAKHGRPRAVLLVDDDDSIIQASTLLLRAAGYEVHSARDHDEAVNCVSGGRRPDLLLCDYRLVGNDGVEVVRRIRRDLAEETPSIILTGDTSQQEIEGWGLANLKVLHKPVDPDRLLALVDSLLS